MSQINRVDLPGAPDAHQSMRRSFFKNAILAQVPLKDLPQLRRYLEPIVLKENMILQEPSKNLDHVYFIESGLVSLRVVAAGSLLETAVIGHRGAVGASLLIGVHVPTHQSVVLFPGIAYKIRIEDLRVLADEIPEIREHLSLYLQALSLHSAQTGLCGVRHDLESRLASWLCLAGEALGTPVLPVTHDYLSSVLGLRRAGVTETLNRFEDQGLIQKTRGLLRVLDSRRLEQKACACHRLISSAYSSPCPTAMVRECAVLEN